MQLNKRRSLFLFIIFFIPLFSVAQKSLDSLEFQYVKNYQPTIADAIKMSDRPSYKDSTQKIPSLSYSINSRKVNTVYTVEGIKPAKMLGEPLNKLYRTMIKFSAGMYTTTNGEIFFNSLRSRKNNYGVYLKHLSSISTLKNYGYSGFSDNGIQLFGKKFLDKQTLSGDVDYTRNVVHYYGYNPSLFELKSDATKQIYNFFSPTVRYQTHYQDSEKINYSALSKYYYFDDKYGSKENNFLIDVTGTGFYEGQLITVKAGVDYYNNRIFNDTNNNTIVKLNPSITSSGEKWKANLGLAAFMDAYSGVSTFKFYPTIDFNYYVIDNILIPYAGITGNLQKNSYRSLMLENPFINSTPILKNTDNNFKLYAGIRGSITPLVSFNTSINYSRIRGLPLFVTDTLGVLDNKFNLIYENVYMLHFHGELTYLESEKLRLAAKLDYNKYDLDNELKAWHKPALQLTFSGNYNLRDKIVAKADIFVIDKRYAPVYTPSSIPNKPTISATALKGGADVNLGLEYRYTKLLSAYINFNNIGAFRYNRWYNYPTQRFSVLLGVSFVF